MSKSADPDQTAQNTKSSQGLHVLLTEISIRNVIKLKKTTTTKKKKKKKKHTHTHTHTHTPENGLVHSESKAISVIRVKTNVSI